MCQAGRAAAAASRAEERAGSSADRRPHATSAAGDAGAGSPAAAAAAAAARCCCAPSRSWRIGVPRSAIAAATLNSSFCRVASAPRSSSSCTTSAWLQGGPMSGQACRDAETNKSGGGGRHQPAAKIAGRTARPSPTALHPPSFLAPAASRVVQRCVSLAVASVYCQRRGIQQHGADVKVAACGCIVQGQRAVCVGHVCPRPSL